MRFLLKQEDEVFWRWELHTKDGPIAQSVDAMHSEGDARSNIARAKKAMSAVRYAKVELDT